MNCNITKNGEFYVLTTYDKDIYLDVIGESGVGDGHKMFISDKDLDKLNEVAEEVE